MNYKIKYLRKHFDCANTNIETYFEMIIIYKNNN